MCSAHTPARPPRTVGVARPRRDSECQAVHGACDLAAVTPAEPPRKQSQQQRPCLRPQPGPGARAGHATCERPACRAQRPRCRQGGPSTPAQRRDVCAEDRTPCTGCGPYRRPGPRPACFLSQFLRPVFICRRERSVPSGPSSWKGEHRVLNKHARPPPPAAESSQPRCLLERSDSC